MKITRGGGGGGGACHIYEVKKLRGQRKASLICYLIYRQELIFPHNLNICRSNSHFCIQLPLVGLTPPPPSNVNK